MRVANGSSSRRKHEPLVAGAGIKSKRSFVWSKLTVAITLLRLCLILNGLLPKDLVDWLYSPNVRSVLIDPVFTMHHVQESVAIRHLSASTFSGTENASRLHFVDVYRGHESDTCRVHLPPLALALAESLLYLLSYLFPQASFWQHLVLGLLLLIVDVWIAETLGRVAYNVLRRESPHEVELLQKVNPKIAPAIGHLFPVSGTAKESPTFLLQWHNVPCHVAHLYYCNPVTILAGSGAPMSFCFQSIRLAFLVAALAESSTFRRRNQRDESSVTTTAITLAVATYLDIHSVMFIVPIAIWHGAGKAKSFGFLWDFFTIALQGLSVFLVGEGNYFTVFRCTHLHQYRLKGITPSLSTTWYFGMELFLRFRPFYEFLLGGLPYLLVIPVSIRLHKYPGVMVAIVWFLGVLFRSPGTLYQLNVGFCFMLMNPRSLSHMHQLSSIIALCAFPIPVLLYIVSYWMWLEPGNGEANYVFFQCLAYDIFVAIIFLNFCSASLRRDKVLRVTEKSLYSTNSNGVANE